MTLRFFAKAIAGFTALVLVAGSSNAATWGTSYGNMELPDQPANTRISTSYPDDGGRVFGSMSLSKGSSAMISGVWAENNSAQKCSSEKGGSFYWGKVYLEFNDAYTSFSGSWDYCGEGGGGSWKGSLGGSRSRSKSK